MPQARVLLSALLLALASTLCAGDQVYVIQKGETLYRIAKKFEIPVSVLQQVNGISDPSQLREGAKIRIPSTHLVQKGDTLYGLSRRYGVFLEDLLKANGLTAGSPLKIGDRLYIPRAEAAAAPENKPSLQEAADKGAALLWPHPGRQESLQGKVSGVLIHGEQGDRVISVCSGRVIYAGPYRGFGRVIFVESPNGYVYVYAGNETSLVAVGDTVAQGAVIGRLGKNAHAGTSQLLFLVYLNGKPVDPSLAPRG